MAQAITNSRTKWENCTYWQSFVDPKVVSQGVNPSSKEGENLQLISDPLGEDSKIDDKRILVGIKCLLKLEGRKYNSVIRGATSPLSSQTFGPVPVEVAALYYISYLYYRKWDHALAAQLVINPSQVNNSDIVQPAYTAYKKWFSILKKLGIKKARERGLDPLSGTGISWYGTAPNKN